MDKLKWQIHAETSLTQIMQWVIIWKLFGGWVGYIAIVFIIGNLFTVLKSVKKVGKNYYD